VFKEQLFVRQHMPMGYALQSLLLADRLIWGSNLSHTQHEDATDFHQIAEDRLKLTIRSDLKAF